MSLRDHVDQYCERASTAFWAEPVNALSNLSFVVAAWLIWRMLAADRADAGRRTPVSVGFMAPLMLCIGVGSFAFHTIGTRWAQVLDVAPIALFVLWYLASFLRWFHDLSWKRCLLGVAAFIAFIATFVVVVGPYVPNKSGTYVPVLMLLVGIAVALARSKDAALRAYTGVFAGAAVVFGVALTARTVDERVCGSFSMGTHFLWHLFDGLLLFIVSRALVHRWRARTAPTGAPGPDTAGSALPAGR